MKSDTASAADLKRTGVITARAVEAATKQATASGADVWLTDPAPRGAGRLAVRCRPNGARLLVYRYTRSDGTRDALALGPYDPQGLRGLDLSEARMQAGAHARMLQSGVGDLRGHFAEQERAEAARKAAEQAAAEAARAAAERGTLRDMLGAYVATLGARPAARDARTMFRLHVTEAFPALAAQQAATVEPEQVRDVLARLIEAGKGRTAAKLRAYLRAAYATGMRARFDPKTGGAFAAFGVRSNPVEPLPSLTEYSRALDRALTLPELRAFWRRLQAQPASAARDFVQSLLLLGGQRPGQLVRVTRADVDLTGGTLAMLDPKGRKGHAKPRAHVVPIVAEALPVIERRALLCSGPGAPLFSATGRVALRLASAGELVRTLAAAMAAAGELEQGPFGMRDLRRTVETHLAALGVSKDVRAQLLSHGIHGVQAAHYDRHSYLPEKRAALEAWARRLTGKDAPAVVALPRRRRGAV